MHAFFCSLLGLLALCLNALARDPDTLVVGMELAYPPFEMTDTAGRPSGVSVDLAEALARFLHRKLEIQNLPFDGLIPSLKTGRIDLILSSMTATAERARAIDFSEPYLQTGLCILAGKNSGIESIEQIDQPGKTVVVKQGTTGHLYSRKLQKARILVLDRENACVLEVVQGKADAFIYDQMSILAHAQQNPETTRPLLSPFQKEAWAIGIRKGNATLLSQVNAFLREYRSSGGFEQLGDRWLGPQKETFRKLGVPFVFE